MDADSPATVIKTLSAQVETVREQNVQLTDDNSALRKTLSELKTRFDQLLKAPPASERTPLLEQLNAHLKRLSNRVHQLETAPKPAPVAVPLAETESDKTALIWIDPLDADAISPKDPAKETWSQTTGAIENPLTQWMNEPKQSSKVSSAETATATKPPEKSKESIPRGDGLVLTPKRG